MLTCTDINIEYSPAIKDKLVEKGKLCKQWKINRYLALKTKLNRAIKTLKNLLELKRNQAIQKYLKKLSSVVINYYL